MYSVYYVCMHTVSNIYTIPPLYTYTYTGIFSEDGDNKLSPRNQHSFPAGDGDDVAGGKRIEDLVAESLQRKNKALGLLPEGKVSEWVYPNGAAHLHDPCIYLLLYMPSRYICTHSIQHVYAILYTIYYTHPPAYPTPH